MVKRKQKNPFRAAKPYLAQNFAELLQEGKEDGICRAIENARDVGEISTTTMSRAHTLVMNRLDGWLTVSMWLERAAWIPLVQRTTDNVQFFRHRWLDHLADEWDQGIRK